jgi:hypothetical protein
MSVNSAARSALPESVTASAAAIAARHEDRRWENLIFRLADCWQIAEFPASRPGASPDSKDVAHPLPNLNTALHKIQADCCVNGRQGCRTDKQIAQLRAIPVRCQALISAQGCTRPGTLFAGLPSCETVPGRPRASKQEGTSMFGSIQAVAQRPRNHAWLVATAALLLATAAAAPANAQETIKIGILHSLSGTMAISETTLKDVMMMLIDEQNKKGGVLGKKLEAVVVDPASDWPKFAEKARSCSIRCSTKVRRASATSSIPAPRPTSRRSPPSIT